MRAIALVLMLVLTACSAKSRPPAYFETHPDDAARVLRVCEAESRRGAECQNAEAGIVAFRRDARMKGYRSAFE